METSGSGDGMKNDDNDTEFERRLRWTVFRVLYKYSEWEKIEFGAK